MKTTHKATCQIVGVETDSDMEGWYNILYQNPYTRQIEKFTTTSYEQWKIGEYLAAEFTYTLKEPTT